MLRGQLCWGVGVGVGGKTKSHFLITVVANSDNSDHFSFSDAETEKGPHSKNREWYLKTNNVILSGG
jgi:hypothetical protein